MGLWVINELGCIPRTVGFVYGIGIGIVFIVALLRKDVTPYLPYISETGAKPPESGLFSITLYIIATLGMITMLLRYMIVEECNQAASNKSLIILSRVSMFFGLLSMCGMVIVGAYPMLTVPSAHGLGAFTLFAGCCVYGLVETIVSFKMVPFHISRKISILRAVITGFGALILVTMTIVTSIGLKTMRAQDGWSGGKYPNDPGFGYVVSGAAGEWSLSLLFVAFFLTFIIEFRGVSLRINVLYNAVTDSKSEDGENENLLSS